MSWHGGSRHASAMPESPARQLNHKMTRLTSVEGLLGTAGSRPVRAMGDVVPVRPHAEATVNVGEELGPTTACAIAFAGARALTYSDARGQ